MSSKSWSRNRNPNAGKYLILKGTCYPDVVKGANPTKQLKYGPGVLRSRNVPREHRLRARDAFYTQDAIKLSEQNLDAIDGAYGAPICHNHDVGDVVGSLHHSWLEKEEERDGKQAMRLMARVPLDERGLRIKRDIDEGRLRGFSVRYKNKFNDNETEVVGKEFQEVSLVPEPFFEGCDLTMSVVAGAEEEGESRGIWETTPYGYITIDSNHSLYSTADFVPFVYEMSDETAAAAPAAAAPATIDQTSAAKDAAEMARQTDMLAQRARGAETEVERLTRELSEYKTRNEQSTKAAMMYRASYAETQKPKADAYIAYLEETNGEKLDDKTRAGYEDAFYDPNQAAHTTLFTKQAEAYLKQKEHAASVVASLEEEKKARVAADEKAAELAKAINNNAKAIEQINNAPESMRAGYASAMSAETAAGADVSMTETEVALGTQFAAGAGRREASVVAGKNLEPGDILCPAPSKNVLPFLADAGRNSQVGGEASVIAGKFGEEHELLPLRTSVPAIPPNTLQYWDETQGPPLQNSMRFLSPPQMSCMTNLMGLPTATNQELARHTQFRPVDDALLERRIDTHEF